MSDTKKDLYPHAFKNVRAGDSPFFLGEVNAVLIAIARITHHLDDLGTPTLPEEARCSCQFGFRRWRVDIDVLRGVVGCQEVQSAHGKAGMAPAKANSEAVGVWKFEVAVDFPHHVEKELVCRIAAMHRTTNFGSRKVADVAPSVIQFTVVLLQPMLELEPKHAAVRLVACHVGYRADAKEWVQRSRWRSAGRGLD